MPENKEDFTTIRLLKTTQARLQSVGTFKDNYDRIVNRLVDFWEEQHTKND